ncbi:T9SS type A sorting domain-containing protein [Pontibacter sp. FD36]|uniref:DNRLRE domain-containing protein n=1 Tax=Pontibacter sp. FD36 TaxID=2789860 RepID=UPI0018ABD142|nr:DNRLRE domain-containing protein [Pontibacter sp. FD36]MBF8961754.1 T9SS type A sorting domain-containing protein [Pontibacter sp. FD36]
MKTQLPFFRGLASLCLLLTLMSHSLQAQNTVTIGAGTDWTDVMLYRNDQNTSIANTNYHNQARNLASAWTSNGFPTYWRTLFRFNLNSIPPGAVIQNATLYLYSDPTATGSSGTTNNQLSGSNAVYFEKVNSNWGETSVTWNNQPATTTSGRIWQQPSTFTTENIQVNLTSFVQDWVSSPSTNYGMRMALEHEQYFRGRAYASEDHTNTAIRPKLIITYSTSSSDPVADEINNIFALLDKTQVPTGFLSDYGREFLPLDVFNGILTDSNRVNIDAWRWSYASLYSSRIYGANSLPTLATVNNAIKNVQSSSGAIPVVMAHANYAYIKPDAFSNNLLKVENNQLRDVMGRTQSPYAERSYFAASPVRNSVSSGTVSLVFKPEIFYNTTGKTPQTFYIDFADGRGYVNTAWNTPVSATYTSDGTRLIKIKVLFTDNTFYECYSQIAVSNTGALAFRYPGEPQLPPHTINARPGIHDGGQLFISLGQNHTTISKPLIVVEGYDASDIAPDLIPTKEYNDFISSINTPIFRVNNQLYHESFNNQLDLAGYDLIFLNFNNSLDDITRNAALFEEVVNWVNMQKGSGGEDNVVLGISMGGLVARYGLAKMTKQGGATRTRLLITHDSPHRGANVPLGFQHLITSIPDLKVLADANIQDLSPAVKAGFDLLSAPASQQMLILRSENGNTIANTFLDNIYRPMVTFSSADLQPSYRFLATSQGSECGQQLFTPYTELGRLDSEFFLSPLPWLSRKALKAEAVINALPEQGTSKRITYLKIGYEYRRFWFIKWEKNLLNISKNAPSYALPWDGAPGGTFTLDDEDDNPYSVSGPNIKFGIFFKLKVNGNIAGEFTFVPTASALDVEPTSPAVLTAKYSGGISVTAQSAADDFIAQDRPFASAPYNIYHTTFTNRNAEWIFNEMQSSTNNTLNCSNECGPTVTISSSSNSVCGGTAYFSVPDYGNGVAYSWSVGPGLSIVSGNGTRQIGVTSAAGNYSSATVSVNVNTKCGTLSASTNITIGSGSAFISNPYDLSCYCQIYGPQTGKTYQFFVDTNQYGVDPSNYRWTITPPFDSPEPYPMEFSGSSIYFDAYYPGEYTFELQQYTPGCGWSVKDTRYFYFSQGYGMYAYAYPNPTSDELNVSLSSAFPEEEDNTDSTYEVRLLNAQQKEVYNKKTKDKQLVIPVQKLKSGTYYLQLNSGTRTVVNRIVIGQNVR